MLAEIQTEIGFVFPENTAFVQRKGNLKIERNDKNTTVFFSIRIFSFPVVHLP